MSLSSLKELVLATSTNQDGNMSLIKGDPEQALKNREKFLNKLGINLSQTVFMHTIHGTDIIKVDKGDSNKPPKDSDGLITNEKDVYLCLLTADCLPISLYDSKKQIIALVHAGWQGLYKGILTSTIDKLKTEFGTAPKDLVIHIGPSIGPCCYKGFPSISQSDDPKWRPYIIKSEDETFAIDLWKHTFDQLSKLGVLSENIENNNICSYHSNDYYSNRKYKAENLADDFRFMTVLGMKS